MYSNNSSSSDDDNDDGNFFRKGAVLPVESTGSKVFNPNAWSDCSAKEFLRNVVLESKIYPSVICSNINYDTEIKNNSFDDSTQNNYLSKFFTSADDDKFIQCLSDFQLNHDEKVRIIEDFTLISKRISSNFCPKPNLKYSEEKWRSICKKSKTLPDKGHFGDLSQEEVIKLIRVQYQILVEKLLNDESLSDQNVFWIWISLLLLDRNQTNETFSLLRNISRTISQFRSEIIKIIQNGKFKRNHVEIVGNCNRIVLIISKIFSQNDLSD